MPLWCINIWTATEVSLSVLLCSVGLEMNTSQGYVTQQQCCAAGKVTKGLASQLTCVTNVWYMGSVVSEWEMGICSWLHSCMSMAPFIVLHDCINSSLLTEASIVSLIFCVSIFTFTVHVLCSLLISRISNVYNCNIHMYNCLNFVIAVNSGPQKNNIFDSSKVTKCVYRFDIWAASVGKLWHAAGVWCETCSSAELCWPWN